MGFTEVLTLIFIAFKLLGVINWSWWLVLLPEIIALVFYIALITLWIVALVKEHKEFKKHWDNF